MIRGMKHLFFENRLKVLGKGDCRKIRTGYLQEHVMIGKGEWLKSV